MLTYYGTTHAIISAPGDYTIDRDITQTSPHTSAIYVLQGVHYVTIRLRSRVVGAGGPYSINSGIECNGSAAVTVIGDGGSIRGFAYGIRMDNCLLARVRGVVVEDATFRGISISGDLATVEDCDVKDVQGALWTPAAYCMGIEVQGLDAEHYGKPKVLRNSVLNVRGTGLGESVGISISDKGRGGVVFGNVVRNPTLYPGSFGLWVGGESDVKFANNVFDTWGFGANFSTPPTGGRGNNTYFNCTTDFYDGGGDVSVGATDSPLEV